MKRELLVGAALLLAGCLDQKSLVEKSAPKQDDEFARRFITLIRDGKSGEAQSMIDRRVVSIATPEELHKLHQILDKGEPAAVDLVGAQTGFFFGGTASKRDTNLTYQIKFPAAWVVADIQVQTNAAGRHVLNASCRPLPASLEVLNRFTFKGKAWIYYLFFAACLLVPLFIIAVLVLCIRSRVRRRWAWIIFILIGFTQFQLNWSTGEWSFRPASFLLLGGSGFRNGLYGPWIISFGLPAGAIIFMLLRHRLRRKGEPPPLPPPLPAHS
ncbi:MAG: hypothetical protein DLM52_12960 [Chthoniobacterales bacterium]|nr:MAG: hypothetical protein DLM52_12960 [Chthoniobacterales bacterium]